MKKITAVILLLIFVIGCQTIDTSTLPSSVITTSHYSLDSFDSITISGNVDVVLASGPYAIDITGARVDRYDQQISVVNKELYVTMDSGDAPRVVAKITAPEFRKIAVAGNATVSGNKFKTNKLVIIAKGQANINFTGKYNIEKIFQFGHGRIDISWIDSDKFLFEGSGNGTIFLAGVVDEMVVKLAEEAKLDARYLRARKATIITTDTARSDILPLDALDAFAADKSNIYYYKKPKYLKIVTKDSGNVLRPVWCSLR